MSLILVSNDDGIYAEGLTTLCSKLQGLGDVVVVAPENERSGVSHGITLHNPLRVLKVRDGMYAINGTPADCIILAINKLLPHRPDLVIAGINHGGNLGDDVVYSGTVAAAREAAIHNIPAFAVSLVLVDNGEKNFEAAAEFSALLARKILQMGLPERTFLNINIPANGYKGVRITRQGDRFATNVISENEDPRGRKYYWIGQLKIELGDDSQSDYEAIHQGMISITPLKCDQTDYESMHALSDLATSLKPVRRT